VSTNSLERAKIVRDPVHGYIDLDKLAFDIINTGAFRRLRWINQHGLAHFVYPGATISRMTHSIGVYHIARQYFESIITNTKKEILKKIFGIDKKEEIQNYYLPILEAAALLHDIGHGPFSHASEPVLVTMYEEDCTNFLVSNLKIKGVKLKAHECITWYIIENNEEINKIFNKYGLKKRDVISVLIGRYVDGSSLNDDQIRVLNYIISSNIDADRLDFVLRDSHFLGVPYGLTDVERIIRVARIERDKSGNYVLTYDIRGLSAIEHFLFARAHMYRWIFYHHIITLLDTVVLPIAIALSQVHGCLSPNFPGSLNELAENPYERYPTDCDVLKALKCTRERIGNELYCYDPENEKIRIVYSVDECIDGEIIHSKLVDSISDRRLLPKSLWKRYEGMVAEISDVVKEEIDKKFNECRERLIKKGDYQAASDIMMQYTSLLRNQYYVQLELNSILGNRDEKREMISSIRRKLHEEGVLGIVYASARSVNFYDDEKPIYISDREVIKTIDMVSSVAGELKRILMTRMLFIYFMDPNKNNREEYLPKDKAEKAYNVATDAIKRYLIEKIIKNNFSKFNC